MLPGLWPSQIAEARKQGKNRETCSEQQHHGQPVQSIDRPLSGEECAIAAATAGADWTPINTSRSQSHGSHEMHPSFVAVDDHVHPLHPAPQYSGGNLLATIGQTLAHESVQAPCTYCDLWDLRCSGQRSRSRGVLTVWSCDQCSERDIQCCVLMRPKSTPTPQGDPEGKSSLPNVPGARLGSGKDGYKRRIRTSRSPLRSGFHSDSDTKRRTSIACQRCRSSKQRCFGASASSSCANCTANGKSCVVERAGNPQYQLHCSHADYLAAASEQTFAPLTRMGHDCTLYSSGPIGAPEPVNSLYTNAVPSNIPAGSSTALPGALQRSPWPVTWIDMQGSRSVPTTLYSSNGRQIPVVDQFYRTEPVDPFVNLDRTALANNNQFGNQA